MINGKRVVAFTPYGRERTVSILHKYLQREHDRGLLDEWWLCMNTDPNQASDVAYAYRLALGERTWIKRKDRPVGCPRITPKQRNTGYFYRYMTDVDTIYVRFDDDMIYLHPKCLERLVRARIAMHDSTLGAFAWIWNNAIVSWYAQQHGKIPMDSGVVGEPFCMDPVGWANGQFAVNIHNQLLAAIEESGGAGYGPWDTEEDGDKVKELYSYQDIPLAPRQQFSVSCFAVDGRDYAALSPPGVLDFPEEEHWLTVHRPGVVNKGNVIIGSALASHYTFFPQRKDPVIAKKLDAVLERYRALAAKL